MIYATTSRLEKMDKFLKQNEMCKKMESFRGNFYPFYSVTSAEKLQVKICVLSMFPFVFFFLLHLSTKLFTVGDIFIRAK